FASRGGCRWYRAPETGARQVRRDFEAVTATRPPTKAASGEPESADAQSGARLLASVAARTDPIKATDLAAALLDPRFGANPSLRIAPKPFPAPLRVIVRLSNRVADTGKNEHGER